MRFGVHLPLADLGDGLLGPDALHAYVAAAASLGYATLAANDHVVWQRPWLDGPATLTSVHRAAGPMALATSITLPVIRHPVVVAKWLTTLGVLAGNRIVAGLGPGSSPADYDAVGVSFSERWARFDESLVAVRALVRGEVPPPGRFHDLGEVRLDPLPSRPPEVWFASWGSDRRLRAMAGVGDGWMASGYNTTPTRFATARRRLDGHLRTCGRDPADFPDMIATMWLYVTEDPARRDHVLHEVLGPVLGRDPGELGTHLPIGTPEHCVELLTAYAQAGVREILLWPVRDPVRQLHVLADLVGLPAPDPLLPVADDAG